MTKQFEDFEPLPVDYEISGPLSVKDTKPLTDDLRHLRDAAAKAGAANVFMNAASPGILMAYIPNTYYKSPEDCFSALVDVLRLAVLARPASIRSRRGIPGTSMSGRTSNRLNSPTTRPSFLA
jgi:hypothetical protein